MILYSLLNCIVVLLYDLARDRLDNFALLIFCDFLFYWYALDISAVFVFYHLFLVWYVADAALT